jgi:PBSX family phage terminase large subunit
VRKIIGQGVKDASGAYVKQAPPPPFKLQTFLFDKQLKFVEDPRPFKVAVCSRRSGKSVACAAHLIDTAINSPNTTSLYITLSRNNAKKLVWKEMQRINKEYGLGGAEDATELSMTFPNGAMIYCSGAKDSSEIEKFRGLALKICYIDECQSFRAYIQELIDDILSPALMDYAGTLVLIGTPGPIPAGYFHDCAEKSAHWSKHSWTFFDNPFIPIKSKKTHQELLDRELRRRGVSATDPSIQREWFGKWVLDTNSLLIRYNAEVNHFTALKDKIKYNYILGIDVGFKDADALALIAWSENDPNTYLIEEKVATKQGLTELVDQVKELQTRYDISKMVIDEGGLGKKLAEEMRRRHHLPVQGADKVRKMESIEFLNDMLRTGKFKAKSDSRFAQDSMLVEIDRDKTRPDKIIVSDKYHSDIIDAVLYAAKESPAFTYQATAARLTPGTPEWAKQVEVEMFEKEMEGLQNEEAFRRWTEEGYD